MQAAGLGKRGEEKDRRTLLQRFLARVWLQTWRYRFRIALMTVAYVTAALLFAYSLGFTGEELLRVPPWTSPDDGRAVDMYADEFRRLCGTALRLNLTKFHFDRPECIWQPLHQVCPLGAPAKDSQVASQLLCVPIEPLEEEEWRNNPARAQRGDVFEILERWIMYKGNILDQRLFQRAIYIDLGTKRYDTSIGSWFRKRYPEGKNFQVIGFEPETKYDRGYQGMNVELHHLLAWTDNTSVEFTGWYSVDDWFGRWVLGWFSSTQKKVALDVADFLRRRVHVDDYVVLKMDIEGSEYRVIPHLLDQGVTHLLDEIFVEPHTNINSCCRHRLDRFRSGALRLIRRLREAGVYAHEWG